MPAEEADAAAGGAAGEAAAAAGASLWGTPAETDAPVDRDAKGHGLWTEPALVNEPDGGREGHARSDKARPWGPVPGLRDDGGWRRGIRTAKPKR